MNRRTRRDAVTHECGPGCVAMARLLAEWQDLREQVAEAERAEHPDITDRSGQVWTWWSGDLYRNGKGAAWPRSFIDEQRG